MAVNIHCRQNAENSDEYLAAVKLKQIFERDWNTIAQVADATACVDIHVKANVLAEGQAINELDLFVAIECARRFASIAADNAGHAVITSMFIVVEVKGHTSNSIKFYQDGEADVMYRNSGYSSATAQNRGQCDATRNFLANHMHHIRNGVRVPWISRACWFMGVNSNQYPHRHLNHPHYLVFNDLTVAELVTRAKMGPQFITEIPDGRKHWNASITPAMCQLLRNAWVVPAPPTRLDRKKLDAITNAVTAIGPQGPQGGAIFSGYGGTGKTFALLANAVHRYRQRDRVLVLTFNLVLTWELRRMISIMDTGSGHIPHEDAGAPCITVETISSWVRQLAVELRLATPDIDLFPADGPNNYKKLCGEVLDIIKICTDRNEIRQNLKTSASYEWVFIDEAQDVPKHEKDLILAVFGRSAFCVSDGLDQFFRAEQATDWRRGPDGDIDPSVTTHRLLQCYRLKSNLCAFVNRFATAIGLDGFRLNPAPNAAGGKVIIHFGSAQKALIDCFPFVSNTNKEDGNAPGDMLICAENSLLNPINIPKEFLEQRGHKFWDGVLPEAQLGHMRSDQIRIVRLEHCRGLEGWCVFLLGLDRFFDERLAQLQAELAPDNPEDFKRIAEAAAKKFITIPLTRAMDTLVIQVESRQSYLGAILSTLQGDSIEHHYS
jgi:hypothetical protein